MTAPAEALEQVVARRLRDVDAGTAVCGKAIRVAGMTIEATGCRGALGSRFAVELADGWLPAEVVGFDKGITHLMPLGTLGSVAPGALVKAASVSHLQVNDRLLGRVIDGLGQPLDGRDVLPTVERSEDPVGINPLERAPITTPLDVGVRALNSLLTVGVGQRIGLFAGSGVGKSVLLGMIARFTQADAVVVAMVGERGREVREFIEDDLGDALAKSVVVAAPADASPVARIRAVGQALAIAERYRADGRQVLLLVDSLTRIAQARREIGLAMGEPPATRGYPPSAFALLPQVLERAGRLESGGGSITGIYTVLMEEDDLQDPVVDAARAVLDGHVVLSRRLADSGHYPAIDIEKSISRLHNKLAPPAVVESSRSFRSLWAAYEQNRDLISVGAYAAGSDPVTDQAIRLRPALVTHLQQRPDERVDLVASREALSRLIPAAVKVPAP